MFEFKLLVTAPGLEAALNNLANAIATGAAPLITVEGDGVIKQPAVTAVPVAPVVEDTDDAGEETTNEFDGWGLRHDTRIHTDSKSINKGDKQWRQKKKLDDAFVDGVKRELIAEAIAAGRYTGPAELAPGFVAPVDTADAAPVVPASAVVPAAPVVPAPPVNADPAKVYDQKVLQSALMAMFGKIAGDRAAPISQKILALYDTQNIMQIAEPAKLKSCVDLIEKINTTPDQAEVIISQAESMKAVGGVF